MVKQKVNNSQINSQYFYSEVGNETAAGKKSFPNAVTNGFTLTNSNTRIVCNVAGTYFISIRQLISTNANQIYYSIRKNGEDVGYAYPKPSVATQDVLTSATVSLAVNDYIEVNMSNSISSAWMSAHSNVTMIRIA